MTDRKSLDLDSLEPFIAPSRADWLHLVEKGLRGAALESLSHVTEDGLPRGPLSTLADRAPAPAAIMRSGVPLLGDRPWHISVVVSDPDLGFANTQLLSDLTGGASAARVDLGAGGVKISRAADFDRLFEQVHTDLIPIQFTAITPAQVGMLLSLPSLRSARLALGLSPLSRHDEAANIMERCPETWRVFTIDTAKVHDAGGTDVQELAYGAASIVHAMKTFGAKATAQHLTLEIAVDRDAHLTIAKTRAVRRLYARIAESFGLSDTTVPVYAVSSHRMMQTVDPWSNMLRLMSAGFGAVVGGADYLTLRPFTAALGDATPFGYRSARNMQLMMMEESRLGLVADPAYGSYVHERLTDELARKAWEKFQSIETAGGIESYVKSAAYQTDIDAAVKARAAASAPIVGVTLHRAEAIREPKLRRAKK